MNIGIERDIVPAGTHLGCGGTILTGGGSGAYRYDYCDRCAAFRYQDAGDHGVPFPSGHAIEENRRAWSGGCERSPEASS